MKTHHEETVINGILNYRKSFTGKWKPYNKKELTKIINILRENYQLHPAIKAPLSN